MKEKEKIRNHWTLEFAKKLDALTQGMRDDLAVTPTLALDILINSALIFTKTVLKEIERHYGKDAAIVTTDHFITRLLKGQK